jgi:STE24 endopeptidase
MSETTAMRMAGGGRGWRLATLVVIAAGWFVAAGFLWTSSKVPSSLSLPSLDPHRYFQAHELARSVSYERFLDIDFLLSIVALLVALGLFAWKGQGFVRESAAGPIGTGMLLGMLAFAIVWIAQLPFGLAALWWERRHGTARQGYGSWLIVNWLSLGGRFLFICLTIVVVMGLAMLLGRRWWVAGVPAFAGIALLFAFVQPYLVVNGTKSLQDPALRADVQRFERIEGAQGTPVHVLKVSKNTDAVNAFAVGLGPSRGVFIYDTFLDGRFSRPQIDVVLAHEIAHIARHHIWKGLAWYALLLIPTYFVATLATRRRGGLAQPVAVPLALFVIYLVTFVTLPAQNVISRHFEQEADWLALQTTRDPAAAQELFRKFGTIDVSDPRPSTWAYVLLADHPTLLQRIAMVKAWEAARASARARASTPIRAGS